jgi:hypothetical protein
VAKSYIKLADGVRRILSRHYINPYNVRIIVGKGHVRVIGNLERAESKAYMPIDQDTISKLKHEIRHLGGVKSVAISSSHVEKTKDEEGQESGAQTALDRKEAQKKAMADALKAAMARKRQEAQPAKDREKQGVSAAKLEVAVEQELTPGFKINLDEEDDAEEPPAEEKPAEPEKEIAVDVVQYKAYPTLTERTWNWGPDLADEVLGENDWERFKAAHLFWNVDQPGHEEENSPKTKDVYHLPHHVVRAGSLKTHWPGIVFAVAALLGEGHVTKMPRLKLREAYNHLSRHYKEQFGKYAPELIETAPPGKVYAQCTPDELEVQPWDYSEFKQYHESQGINMWWLTLEAWEAAVSGTERYGSRKKKKQEEEAKKSGRLFKKLSTRFKSAMGKKEKTSLSEPVGRLAGAIADTALNLEKTGIDRRQSEKLFNLAGALRTFVEKYSHANKFDISASHADLLNSIDKEFARVFEHIAPTRYTEEDLTALLATVDEMTLLAQRFKEE